MPEQDDPAEPTWQPALALLDEIVRRTEAGAVLRASYRAGCSTYFLDPRHWVSSRTPWRPTKSASALCWMCCAASASPISSPGVGHSVRGGSCRGWRVTSGSKWLPRGAARENEAIRDQLHKLTGLWRLAAQDRLAIARGVSFNPVSPGMAGMLRRDLGLLEQVVESVEAGGWVLELGCGVGSRLTALALTFQNMHGVGIELDQQLVEYGRDRARELAVGDRVSYVVGDALRTA